MQQQQITLTYDQADLDFESVQAARGIALQSLIKDGVTDLNAVTIDQLDRMFCIFKLAYENRVAARNHQLGIFAWRMVFMDHTTGELTEQVITQS